MDIKVCKTCGHGVTNRTLEIIRQKEKKLAPPKRRSKKEKVRDLAQMFLQRYRAEDK